VTPEEEEVGLDLTQHGERGYIMGVGELLGGHSSAFEATLPMQDPVHVPGVMAERVGH
jgi:hypothetical protein